MLVELLKLFLNGSILPIIAVLSYSDGRVNHIHYVGCVIAIGVKIYDLILIFILLNFKIFADANFVGEYEIVLLVIH
jgi:hypothetical protein